jgi:hypothetical protein
VKLFAGFFLLIFTLSILAACVTTGEFTDASQSIKFTDGPDGARATMNDSILFAVNSSELFEQSNELFDALKPVLQRSKGKIIVEGHTDSKGAYGYNMKLSQRRAEAVKAALVARQVAPSRIEVRGYGSSRPVIAKAKTHQEHAQNRRAVIVFQGETVESIGGNNIEKTLTDISNKINDWFGTLFKKDVATPTKVAAEVKKLNVSQNGDKAVATYDLVGVEGEQEAEVTVAITIDGVRHTAEGLKLTGDFGKGVKVGQGKKIIWNATADLPSNFEGDLSWDVQAISISATSLPEE